MKTICLLCLLLAATATKAVFAQTDQKLKVQTVEAASHDYAPLREAGIEIKDFTFPSLDDSQINLRESARGKKLTLVHYFAAWCHSSNFDVKTMTEIYDKHREQGLLVIGVCEYSSRKELREFIEKHKPTYPICIEGDGKSKDRTRTTHYAYRKQVDDQRKWGTPFNILIADGDIQSEGEIVARRVRLAPGEVIKTELEEIIRRHLGLNR
jgi:peroxiredoxin